MERRFRLGRRHRLATGSAADDLAAVAGSLAGLHASDPATVYLSAMVRMSTPSIAAVERGLYDDRTVVRMLAMRRTMFIEPLDLVPAVHHGATLGLLATQRRQLARLLTDAGVATDGGAWFDAVADETLAALRRRGSATTREIQQDVPELRRRLVLDVGKRTETEIGVASRVMFLMGVEGRVVRGRPLGSWISSQYRWHPADEWVRGGIPPLEPADARTILVARWLHAFGPAPRSDLKWWTKWTVKEVDRALAAVGAVEVDLDGTAGYVLGDDLEPVDDPGPWTALLPMLDPTPMGWQQRDWFLGPHRERLFDRFGNIGPTIWSDGRIVGGWAQRPDGEIAIHLLEDIGRDARSGIETQAHQIATLVGPTRFIPRFRTPLERQLVS